MAATITSFTGYELEDPVSVIWIEHEMVSPKTESYEKHPDRELREPGRPEYQMRGQLVLDLANQRCRILCSMLWMDCSKNRLISPLSNGIVIHLFIMPSTLS